MASSSVLTLAWRRYLQQLDKQPLKTKVNRLGGYTALVLQYPRALLKPCLPPTRGLRLRCRPSPQACWRA